MITPRPFSVALAVTCLASCLGAQPKRERLAFERVMALRAQLAVELRGADDEVRRAVAEDLRGRAAHPFDALARALARMRGVEADDAFCFRLVVQCYATPEVVDGGRFPAVNLTMHAPTRVAGVGEVRFEPVVRDSNGEVKWRGTIGEDTAMDDLLRYRATIEVPIAGFADGRYEVEVPATINGAAPRPGDPVARAHFYVVGGFPELVAETRRRVEAVADRVTDEDMLRLKGALREIERVYTGEPPAGVASDVLADMARVEAMLQNLEAGEPACRRLVGWTSVGVRIGAEEATVVEVRLPKHPLPGRPLVVAMGGRPTWDRSWSQPSSPRTTPPRWLRDQLIAAGFDPQEQFALAVMESPGSYHNAAQAIAAVVPQLRVLLGAGERTILIGEREGALAITGALRTSTHLADEVVLINGGAVDPSAAKRLAGRRLMVAYDPTDPLAVNVARAVELLQSAQIDVTVVENVDMPWTAPLDGLLPRLLAFLER